MSLSSNSNESHNIWMIILLQYSALLKKLAFYIITQCFTARFDCYFSRLVRTSKYFTKLSLFSKQPLSLVLMQVIQYSV